MKKGTSFFYISLAFLAITFISCQFKIEEENPDIVVMVEFSGEYFEALSIKLVIICSKISESAQISGKCFSI